MRAFLAEAVKIAQAQRNAQEPNDSSSGELSGTDSESSSSSAKRSNIRYERRNSPHGHSSEHGERSPEQRYRRKDESPSPRRRRDARSPKYEDERRSRRKDDSPFRRRRDTRSPKSDYNHSRRGYRDVESSRSPKRFKNDPVEKNHKDGCDSNYEEKGRNSDDRLASLDNAHLSRLAQLRERDH